MRVRRFTVSVSPVLLSMWRDFRELHILSKNFPDVSIATTSGGNLYNENNYISKISNLNIKIPDIF